MTLNVCFPGFIDKRRRKKLTKAKKAYEARKATLQAEAAATREPLIAIRLSVQSRKKSSHLRKAYVIVVLPNLSYDV
jgi:hypothetical protein